MSKDNRMRRQVVELRVVDSHNLLTVVLCDPVPRLLLADLIACYVSSE